MFLSVCAPYHTRTAPRGQVGRCAHAQPCTMQVIVKGIAILNRMGGAGKTPTCHAPLCRGETCRTHNYLRPSSASKWRDVREDGTPAVISTPSERTPLWDDRHGGSLPPEGIRSLTSGYPHYRGCRRNALQRILARIFNRRRDTVRAKR